MSCDHARLCADDDNALDAVIAALAAHAVLTNSAVGPTEAQRETALREGWIWMPQTKR